MMKLYTNAMALLYSFKNDERGVTAIEYGLIGIAMATAIMLIFSGDANSFIGQLKAAYTTLGGKISTAANGIGATS